MGLEGQREGEREGGTGVVWAGEYVMGREMESKGVWYGLESDGQEVEWDGKGWEGRGEGLSVLCWGRCISEGDGRDKGKLGKAKDKLKIQVMERK